MLKYKVKSSLIVATGGVMMFSSISLLKNDENFYKNIVMPVVRKLDPETSHKLSIAVGKRAPFLFINANKDDDILRTKVWNLTFANPIGLAAGFDKQGEAITALFGMGFGFMEVGSVTPEAQLGNPTPRVFRLIDDRAIINRYGFNSDGHKVVKMNVDAYRAQYEGGGILGINLGQNKTSTEPSSDYVKGIETFGSVADFLVINISSPNTPGLRNLQRKKSLEDLIDKVLVARSSTSGTVPILVKIAPDLSEEELNDIVQVITVKKVDGVIISNTTISRPSTLQSPLKYESGGLSGAPLSEMSTKIIERFYKLTKGSVPIIGVGGVQSGHDAYVKIRAGASLIELYSVLTIEGPPVVQRIKRELTQLLKDDGYTSVCEAVGAAHKLK